MKVLLALLLLTSNAFAMCECKSTCRKDFDFKEFATEQEAIIEGKKHKAISVQKYGDKYQLLIWNDHMVCETFLADTCQCGNEKY